MRFRVPDLLVTPSYFDKPLLVELVVAEAIISTGIPYIDYRYNMRSNIYTTFVLVRRVTIRSFSSNRRGHLMMYVFAFFRD
jgi:hypothetical protein